MNVRYQIVSIGEKSDKIDMILDTFFKHIEELGLLKETISTIDENNFVTEYQRNAPTFCFYFGSTNGSLKNTDILKVLLEDARLILPIVNDLSTFSMGIPKELHHVNGFLLASDHDVERLVSSMLEGLGLLRLSRRLFISYKRDESSTVAIQLFEQLEKNGFDVFLDTHSIRPGERFQDELWHRMADTDIMVLLNTKGFLGSCWTTQELARANDMSIGILQVIWPDHKLERDAELSVPIQMEDGDFGNKIFTNSKAYLTDVAIQRIVQDVESLRARSLASRQNNIIKEFIDSAKKENRLAYLQPDKLISFVKQNGSEVVIIPTVGVPQAFTYNQSEELVHQIKEKKVREAFVLFDHRNIRESWLKHLSWLDNYLPVKSIRIHEADTWLKNN